MTRKCTALAVFVALFLSAPAHAKTTSLLGVVNDSGSTDKRTAAQTFATPAGETGTISLAVLHAAGGAYDLTGAQLLLAVNGSTISRQATISSPPSAGLATFPLVIADTLSMRGVYTYDVWLTDASGNRWEVVPPSNFTVTPAQGQPAQSVTVPASQQPLAIGPQGVPGLGLARTAQSTTYTAHLLDYVAANSTSGSFTVTLPLTSSVTATSGNIVYVKNIGTANSVTVAPGGSDTIDIGSIALAPGEVLPVIAHAGAWEALQ